MTFKNVEKKGICETITNIDKIMRISMKCYKINAFTDVSKK